MTDAVLQETGEMWSRIGPSELLAAELRKKGLSHILLTSICIVP